MRKIAEQLILINKNWYNRSKKCPKNSYYHIRTINIESSHFGRILAILTLTAITTTVCSTDGSENQFCPVQNTSVLGGEIVTWYSSTKKWRLDPQIHSEILSSHPPCVDEHNNLVTRSCIDGRWSPWRENSCVGISSNYGQCPNYFQYVENHCVIFIDNQTWDSRNEIPVITSKPNHAVLAPQVLNKQRRYIWLPMRRLTNFGPFESTDPDNEYGIEQLLNFPDLDSFFRGDCILLDAKTKAIQADNCGNRHTLLYRDTHLYSSKCPRNCIPAAHLDNSRCLCKSNHGLRCGNGTVATITSLYDKRLVQRLVGNDTCYVREATNSSGMGLKSVISKNFWQYTNKPIDCSICLIKADELHDTSLVLTFEESKKALYLVVYYPENLRELLVDFPHEHNSGESGESEEIFDDQDEDDRERNHAIFCFTDASIHLKKRVDIEKVWEQKLQQTILHHSLSIYFAVYKLELEDLRGQYWCEGFYMNMTKLVSNTVVAYSDEELGNEYALRLLWKRNLYDYNPSTDNYIESITKYFEGRLLPQKHKLRIMKIFDFHNNFIDLLLHITMKSTNNNVTAEYYRCLSILRKYDFSFFRNTEACMPEITTELNGRDKLNLKWRFTRIGESTISEPPCLTATSVLVIRSCQGSFFEGAHWSDVQGECTHIVWNLSSTTNSLLNFSHMDKAPLQEVSKLVNEATNLTMVDIYYISRILENFEGTVLGRSNNHTITQFISDLVSDIINKLMDVDLDTLDMSQNLLNLTDITLNLMDDFLLHTDLNSIQESVLLIRRENFLVHVTNPFVSNISGLVIYGEKNETTLKEFRVENFERNHSWDMIDTSNLKAAIHVPETVLNQISLDSPNDTSNINIVTVIFYKDSFFRDNKFEPISYVASLSIPGYGSYLESPVPILFRSTRIKKNSNGTSCAFWDNGRKSNRKKGEWSTTGAFYLGKFLDDSIHLCTFTHLTPFVLLITSDKSLTLGNGSTIFLDEIANNEYSLNTITIIGGMLSFLGICCIFLTAIICDEWRRKIGTKILLNLSIAILLETVCIHLSEIGTLRRSVSTCKLLGMILHYVVVSKFCWMLIYAVLQYLRFVKVLGPIPQRLLLKSVLFGWGLPLILVLIVGISTTSQSYVSGSYELCYPRGTVFYLSVMLPICAIIAANLTVFCIIMYQISQSEIKSVANNKTYRLQLKLAILLFFVLGIPWIFGILAELMIQSVLKIILFYVFSITGTLQGFVMSLFYVLLNKEVRRSWTNYIKSLRTY